MPYIEQRDRYKIDEALEDITVDVFSYSVGDMNYVITSLIHKWVKTHGGLRYAILSQARAVLKDAHDEFYRTVVAPYEDIKRKENGSVSGLDREKTE